MWSTKLGNITSLRSHTTTHAFTYCTPLNTDKVLANEQCLCSHYVWDWINDITSRSLGRDCITFILGVEEGTLIPED